MEKFKSFCANIMHANKLSETWRCVYVINANKEHNPLKVKKLTQFENCCMREGERALCLENIKCYSKFFRLHGENNK